LEVYASVFNEKHQKIREIKAEIIDENSFCEYLERSKVYFLGD
jgi:tRNA threonylcarbamoyladenosine biosynthesis protein TsaB